MQFLVALSFYIIGLLIAVFALSYFAKADRISKINGETAKKTRVWTNILLIVTALSQSWLIYWVCREPTSMASTDLDQSVLGVSLQILPTCYIFAIMITNAQILSIFGCLFETLDINLSFKIDHIFVRRLRITYVLLYIFLCMPRYVYFFGLREDTFGWISYYLQLVYGLISVICDNVQSFVVMYITWAFAKKKTKSKNQETAVVSTMMTAVLVICCVLIADYLGLFLQLYLGVSDPALAVSSVLLAAIIHMSGLVFVLGTLKEVTHSVIVAANQKTNVPKKESAIDMTVSLGH